MDIITQAILLCLKDCDDEVHRRRISSNQKLYAVFEQRSQIVPYREFPDDWCIHMHGDYKNMFLCHRIGAAPLDRVRDRRFRAAYRTNTNLYILFPLPKDLE